MTPPNLYFTDNNTDFILRLESGLTRFVRGLAKNQFEVYTWTRQRWKYIGVQHAQDVADQYNKCLDIWERNI